MVAHILMTQLDPDLPASLSPAVVTDLLRGELGFGGVVFTDDLTMGAITQNYGLGEAAVLTVEAGCDMLLVCHGRDSVDAARSAVCWRRRYPAASPRRGWTRASDASFP